MKSVIQRMVCRGLIVVDASREGAGGFSGDEGPLDKFEKSVHYLPPPAQAQAQPAQAQAQAHELPPPPRKPPRGLLLLDDFGIGFVLLVTPLVKSGIDPTTPAAKS